MRELWGRFYVPIIILFLTLVMLSVGMLCLFLWAMYAELMYAERPCDQPLKYFVLISVLVGQIKQLLVRCRQQRSSQPWLAIVIAAVPSWLVIVWGIWMLATSKTCAQTNPGLYYPTKYYVFGQVVFCVLTTLFFSVGFTAVRMFLSSRQDHLRPGCEKAVHRLPHIPADSAELVDPEDGRAMECPICTEDLRGSGAVVRTRCEHYFHEVCLARWCTNHLDCPLCRAQVGDTDTPGAGAAGC